MNVVSRVAQWTGRALQVVDRYKLRHTGELQRGAWAGVGVNGEKTGQDQGPVPKVRH